MPSVVIKLRLVGASTDLQHLVFTSRKTGRRGSHVTTIDDKLFRVLEDVVRKQRAAKRGEAAAAKAAAPPVEPKLAPREVQRLLRAGRTVEQVARQAGTEPAWVQRFLGPVLDERAIAIQGARRLRLEKSRLGMSGMTLGESVQHNLRAKRVKITDDELENAWGAARSDSQPWTITLTFVYRGREQRAAWRYDPHAREITASNKLASDIGWVAGPRRFRTATAGSLPRARTRARAKPATSRRATTAKRRAPAKRRAAPKRRAPAKRRAAPKRKPPVRRKAPAKRKPSAKRRAAPKRKPAAKRRPVARRRPAAKRRPAARRRAGR